jgi:MinD-like ATPase involved in chromosome partitioning or flagellar assembly
VDDKKRLGRGLNEISHLFISQKEEKKSGGIPYAAPHCMVRIPRSFAVLSLIPYPPGPFLVSLAISLAFHRAKVLMVDFKGQAPDLGTLLGFPKLASSIQDYLGEKERPFRVQFSSQINLLAFHLKESDLHSLPYHEREIFLQGLLDEEFASEYLLVHVPIQKTKGQFLGASLVHDLLLFTSPNPNYMLDTYRVIKQVLQANENLHIGVLYSEPNQGENTVEAFKQLTGATKKFLGASMSYLGVLPPLHQIIRQKSKETGGLSEKKPWDSIPDSLFQLGERIIKGEGFNPFGASTPFFEKVFSQTLVKSC